MDANSMSSLLRQSKKVEKIQNNSFQKKKTEKERAVT
jgi:hypothetical protein